MSMRRKQSELVGIMKKKCRAPGLLKESNNSKIEDLSWSV